NYCAMLSPVSGHWPDRNPAAQQSAVCYSSEAREVLGSETARVHHAARRRDRLAARSTRAATGNASDRLPACWLIRGITRQNRCISQGLEGARLRRGP